MRKPGSDLRARIPELDGMRGIAISLVLVWHLFYLPSIGPPDTFLSSALVLGRLTWTGVDLFFVLSGFLIGGILLDARTATNYFQVFYTRRFFRIFPIYAAILLIFPVLAFLRHERNFTGAAGTSPPWYLYWIFTQNLWMAVASSLGTNSLSMTWSLAVEEQFYLTLPLLVRRFSGGLLTTLVLVGVVTAPLLRVSLYFHWPHNWGVAYVLMPCRSDALLLGVLAAIMLRNEQWSQRILRRIPFFAVLFPVLLIGVVLLDLRSPSLASPLMRGIGYSWIALFYASALVFALTRPNSLLSRALRMKWLGWLGTIAYGTYLFHQGIQRLIFRLLSTGTPHITDTYTFAISVAALVLTLVIARLSWRFFELPLMRIGHSVGYRFLDSREAVANSGADASLTTQVVHGEGPGRTN